ncbi:MAG TPA: glycine zipper 2TM domain-containing protein [Sphingobium sp.]|uniref:glycine zipper 2TM domain-containing protein n=1 Tax=Sphingobium sp. TaxID=1912891 RepID=UPI002ECFAFE4
MNRMFLKVALAAPLAALVLSAPADARRHHHRETYAEARARHDADHGNCLRFNKTTGTVAGAVAGGLLGRALDGGGATGTLLGAGAGGLAGHSLAHNGRKRC